MDILKINTCPLCGGKHLGHAITCTDHYASGEQFNLVRCDDCGFIFTQGAPVEAEIGRYYETPDYISHTDIRKGLMNRVYHEVRKYMLSRKAKLIKRTSGLSKGTLLDIGTGTGYFSNTMNDIDSMYMGMYFLELADYYGREGIEASDTLRLLYLSMKALTHDTLSNQLVRCIYELKTLVINGEYPNLFTCGNCGKTEHLDYYDPLHDTMICKQCHGPVPKNQIISDSALYALQFIVTSPFGKLFTFTVTEEILEEMNRIVESYMKKHIDKKFHSLEFL